MTALEHQKKYLSPGQRSWLRFKANRRGYVSLWLFGFLFIITLFAEVLCNDKPLLVHYNDTFYFPVLKAYPETTFGGDFETEADYADSYVRELITAGDNWVIDPVISYSFDSINFASELPNPAPPSEQNLLGTDDRGRDVFARLVYGFRISVWFALALTAVGVFIGIFMGAVQGYFSGRLDLFMQRVIEVWASMPELYLLIIFAS
ncbi:MAG: ABC transporter permease, partial [Gammaproteobacteria bacterium]